MSHLTRFSHLVPCNLISPSPELQCRYLLFFSSLLLHPDLGKPYGANGTPSPPTQESEPFNCAARQAAFRAESVPHHRPVPLSVVVETHFRMLLRLELCMMGKKNPRQRCRIYNLHLRATGRSYEEESVDGEEPVDGRCTLPVLRVGDYGSHGNVCNMAYGCRPVLCRSVKLRCKKFP